MLSLLLFLLALGSASAQWPMAATYSPDTMPIIDIKLAPPAKALPQVVATLGQLIDSRAKGETEGLLLVEAAYNSTLVEESRSLAALIDKLMQPVATARKQSRFLASGKLHKKGTVFRELGGHEITARISVLREKAPEASLEKKIKQIDNILASREREIFTQARSELAALAQVVHSEIEAEITQELGQVRKYGQKRFPKAVEFLQQPAIASGPQLSTAVRISAADKFPTIADLVGEAERKHSGSSALARARILELETELVRALNNVAAGRLAAWMEQLA